MQGPHRAYFERARLELHPAERAALHHPARPARPRPVPAQRPAAQRRPRGARREASAMGLYITAPRASRAGRRDRSGSSARAPLTTPFRFGAGPGAGGARTPARASARWRPSPPLTARSPSPSAASGATARQRPRLRRLALAQPPLRQPRRRPRSPPCCSSPGRRSAPRRAPASPPACALSAPRSCAASPRASSPGSTSPPAGTGTMGRRPRAPLDASNGGIIQQPLRRASDLSGTGTPRSRAICARLGVPAGTSPSPRSPTRISSCGSTRASARKTSSSSSRSPPRSATGS